MDLPVVRVVGRLAAHAATNATKVRSRKVIARYVGPEIPNSRGLSQLKPHIKSAALPR